MRLCELLGQLRERKNLSKQRIADILEKGISSWLSVESGRANPQLATLIRVGQELEFELELHAREKSYLLTMKDGLVMVNDRPPRMKTRRLERLIENLTPDQVEYLCNLADVAFSSTQKKKVARGGR